MNEDPRSEPGLFDLPLEPAPAASARRQPPLGAPTELEDLAVHPETLPLFSDEEIDRHLEAQLEAEQAEFEETPPRPRAVPDPPTVSAPASMASRSRAGCGDLAMLAAAGLAAAVGARALAAPIGADQVAPLTLFVLVFSFLYTVVPLTFWGGTPGMIWAGLVARTSSSEPLSFGQSVLRWLGNWTTLALFGLPGLLALTGRSLADRVSGSTTFEQVPAAGRA